MVKEEQEDSMVKESSLLDEAMNLEILGPQSLSEIRGGIKIYIVKQCKDKPYADCSVLCSANNQVGCGLLYSGC